MAAHPPAPDATHAAVETGAHGGEQAAEGGAFPPFDAGLFASQLIWFAITFGALYFILSRFVLPQIGNVLAKRAAAISSDIDQAAKKSAEADHARAAMERATAKARADARALIEAARAEVQTKLSAEQNQAEARLIERIRSAETRVDAARTAALREVPALADALARDIADKLAPQGAPVGARA